MADVLVTLEEAGERGHLLDALAGSDLSVERFLVVEPTLKNIFLKRQAIHARILLPMNARLKKILLRRHC